MCVAVLQVTSSSKPGAPVVLDPATNREAYAIYAMALERIDKGHADRLLVQQETTTETDVPTFLYSCVPAYLPRQTGEWVEVARDFQQQNGVERLLQPVLPQRVPYSFIRKAAITADNARLLRLYPPGWQARPGEIEYVAFSSVGFNRARTKAILYSHQRASSDMGELELKDGKWQFVGEHCGQMA